jgi:predicted regulator of Ras-like GTPase activity (Roadblock/LC7/MglB family)
MAEGVEETFKRFFSHSGVLGMLVLNGDGIAIRSTFEKDATVAYAALVSGLAARARSVVKHIGGAAVRACLKQHRADAAPCRSRSQ